MTTNTDTHVYKLRFTMDKDASASYVKRWNELKQDCEQGENKWVVTQITQACELRQNKELPYLKRTEGGLGGNDNRTNKQLRFRRERIRRMLIPKNGPDDDIVMEISNTELESWTYEELDDLIYVFIKVAESHVQCENCLRGWVEMTPVDGYRY